MKSRENQSGVSLLEVLISMVIITMVAGGIITAMIQSRRVTIRSSSELSTAGLVSEVAEALRSAVNGPITSGDFAGADLTVPGIFVDANMNAATRPAGATAVASLNLPDDFRTAFQTGVGTGTTMANHGDGRVVVIENAPVDNNPANGSIDAAELAAVDLDGDGQAGIDFNNDGVTDLRRVRVKVKFTAPTSS